MLTCSQGRSELGLCGRGGGGGGGQGRGGRLLSPDGSGLAAGPCQFWWMLLLGWTTCWFTGLLTPPYTHAHTCMHVMHVMQTGGRRLPKAAPAPLLPFAFLATAARSSTTQPRHHHRPLLPARCSHAVAVARPPRVGLRLHAPPAAQSPHLSTQPGQRSRPLHGVLDRGRRHGLLALGGRAAAERPAPARHHRCVRRRANRDPGVCCG